MEYGQQVDADRKTGAFRFGPIAPGTYWLGALDGNDARHVLGTYDVARDQALDLGRIVLPRPGRLVVKVSTDPAIDPREMHFSASSFDRSDTFHILTRNFDKAPDGAAFAPGEYVLRVSGTNRVASESHPFTIHSDEDTIVEVHPKPGAMRTCRIAAAPGDRIPAKIQAQVTDADGRVVEDCDRKMGELTELEIGYVLAPGDYTIRASTDDGRKGETRLHVELGPSNTMCEVVLH